MTESICPSYHAKDPERPRASRDGVRLCEGHYAGMVKDLHALPTLHTQLARFLVESGGDGTRTSRTSVGIALNPAVVATRDHIKATLVAWTRIALEEGPWRVPPPDDCAEIAHWLDLRADWLANREWSYEIAHNLAETAHEARRLLQPDKPYLVEIGACPETVDVVHEETGEPGIERCDGTIIAVMRRADSLLPSMLRCTSHADDEDDPHAWGAAEWHILGRRMGRTLNADAMTALVQAIAG